MIKYFFMAIGRSNSKRIVEDGPDIWIRDPLAHPDIEAMDERQRGDLPFHGLASAKAACENGAPRHTC